MDNEVYIQYSFLMGQLVRKLNLLNKEQKVCYGLTLPQCYTIETLGSKGSQTMKELSHDMGVNISTMTRVVNLLVRDDIVCRKQNPHDRREVIIDLTNKGRSLEIKLRKCSESYSKIILEQIPNEKQAMILASLKFLIDAVDAASAKCCPR